jgi:hypothetical protein
MRWLLIPKQFLRVFDKTYQHYDRGTQQADEEHNLEEPHAKDCDLHAFDCSGFLLHLPPTKRRFVSRHKGKGWFGRP